jgi:hypothetical protein
VLGFCLPGTKAQKSSKPVSKEDVIELLTGDVPPERVAAATTLGQTPAEPVAPVTNPTATASAGTAYLGVRLDIKGAMGKR